LDIKKNFNSNALNAWHIFVKQAALSQEQEKLFLMYLEQLIAWNKKTNITRITSIQDVITYHFQDSLYITDFIDFTQLKSICDVGTGGGFPGIPLKIKYPHLSVVLLEVNSKKIAFLNAIIELLQLKNIYVSPYDWRTFLRIAPEPVDLFCARASLKPDELMRVFKPGCAYNNSTLVYWASEQWELGAVEKKYFTGEHSYKVGNKRRRYIVFNHKQEK